MIVYQVFAFDDNSDDECDCDHDDDDDDDDDDDHNDDVEHVYWQPFFGRNPSQELSGKYHWFQKMLDVTLLFPDIGAAVEELYSLTICSCGFHEPCT